MAGDPAPHLFPHQFACANCGGDADIEATIAGLRDGLGLGPSPRALTLARRFHEAYERLAPAFGYETRPETREFDPRTKNGRLMVAVCEEMLRGKPKNPAAVAMGKLGGAAAAKKMTKEELSARGRKGAAAQKALRSLKGGDR